MISLKYISVQEFVFMCKLFKMFCELKCGIYLVKYVWRREKGFDFIDPRELKPHDFSRSYAKSFDSLPSVWYHKLVVMNYCNGHLA